MQIFIDEAGQFTPQTNWSTLCALSIPCKEVNRVRRRLHFISKDWPRASGGELKGGSLSSTHLKILCNCLLEHDVLVHLSGIDVAKEPADLLEKHRLTQCEGITKHLTSYHQSTLVNEVWDLRRALERMPMQLYIQSVLISDLVARIVEDTTLYFSQRRPRELSSYTWTLDAKGPQKITTYEQWWLDTVAPLLESRSKREPLNLLKDKTANYTFFDQSYVFIKEETQSDGTTVFIDGFDIRKIISNNVSFIDSRNDVMIQATDILGNFFRRLMNGIITDKDVAISLGRNQITRKHGNLRQSAHLLTLSGKDCSYSSPIGSLLNLMARAGRSMLKPQRRFPQ